MLDTSLPLSYRTADDESTACDGWQICIISIEQLDAARRASSTLSLHPEMYSHDLELRCGAGGKSLDLYLHLMGPQALLAVSTALDQEEEVPCQVAVASRMLITSLTL
eukprot:scaffold41637_cov82-Cyclotella_meneghiniana.AAC.3